MSDDRTDDQRLHILIDRGDAVLTKYDQKKGEVYEWIDQLQQDPDNEEVQEKLVKAYENLVKSLARKYAHNRTNVEDLVQVGMIGLIIAAKRFNQQEGNSFEAFAIPTIIGEIKRYIRDKTWSIHVPRRIKELGPQINRMVDELTIDLQRMPTMEELAAKLDVSEEELFETMEISKNYKALSVDYKYDENAEGNLTTLLDLVGYRERNFDHVDRKLLLESIIPILTEREQKIIKYLFFDHLSQQEVADKLGISQMHVSRLQRQALLKLREHLEKQH